MIGADGSGKTAVEIRLPLTVPEGTKLQRNAVVIRERQDISLRRAAINLSGSTAFGRIHIGSLFSWSTSVGVIEALAFRAMK